MILVTQGHEKGIGLEVFIKSFLCLPSFSQSKFKLFCNKETLIETLRSINISFDYLSDRLLFSFIESNTTQTIRSMNLAIDEIHSRDILLTLPSSKEQFIYKDKVLSGHTEYFRNVYSDSNIVMSFISKDLNVLLLTDHIRVNDIGRSITQEMVTNKVSLFLNNIKSLRNIDRVYFSGVNPHNGENGMMGDEDNEISKSIVRLKQKFSNISFLGPIAADTLFFNQHDSNTLFIYAYHDQGLSVFKQHNGLQGINLTLGLPFIRVSPDHGTAFELYGKDRANYLGMNYLLDEILKWQA
jgi:4-hydroxythreonine-4-phosphate dehydrogenase